MSEEEKHAKTTFISRDYMKQWEKKTIPNLIRDTDS